MKTRCDLFGLVIICMAFVAAIDNTQSYVKIDVSKISPKNSSDMINATTAASTDVTSTTTIPPASASLPDSTTTRSTTTKITPTTSTPISSTTLPITTTTMAPKTNSTIAPKINETVTLTKKPANRGYRNYYCECDFGFNICDANCCCDIDCNAEMIKVFDCSTKTIDTEQYNYNFLQSCEIQGGLLCIIKDNSHAIRLPSFDWSLRKKISFEWPQIFNTDALEVKSVDFYEANSNILIYDAIEESITSFGNNIFSIRLIAS